MRRTAGVIALGLLATFVAAGGPPATASPPPGAEACPMFPADSFWHADVRSLPVHPRSAAWLAAMGGPSRRLHPDFGDSGGPQPYGIPYKVVDSSRAKVSVDFEYADESDPGPYPFGPDVPVEGGSDRHALMLDRDACVLSELFAVDWNGGSPTAGSGAVFDLRSNALRPAGWTSADAAGLPILPGLLRRDEVLAGRVDHPIRMTASRTDRSFVWPARHQAGAARDPDLPPMGAWFRLKADHPTAGLHPHTVVILEAFKTHGLLLADNGSNWYFTGAADAGWESRVLNELKALTAGSFEAIDQSSLMVDPNSGAVRGGGSPAPATTAAPATTTAPPTTTAAPSPTTTPRRAPTPPTSVHPQAEIPASTFTDVPGSTEPPAPSTTPGPVDTVPSLDATTAPPPEVADHDSDPVDATALAAPRRRADDGSATGVLAASAVAVLLAAGVALVIARRRRSLTGRSMSPPVS